MLDETSDISHKSQLSVVLRYVNNCGVPVERFLFFKDVSGDRSAEALCNIVRETIFNWGCENKLIAQTYDGAAVMAGALNGTQKKVKDIFPEAMFVHCCAHVLNLVLSQSVSFIKDCKLFFATISGIASFFSVSTKRNNVLNETINKKFPKLATTRWNYSSRLVNTIKSERQGLSDLFENIIENPEGWDNDTINIAHRYHMFFEEFNGNFLLNIFAQVFSYTDVLFNILQKTNLDIAYSSQKVEEVKSAILNMRTSDAFAKVYEDTISIVGPPNLKKRRCTSQNSSVDQYFKNLYFEIMDTIYYQLDVRFKRLASLKFFELLNFTFFNKYQNNFPDECFNSLKNAYAKHFDFVKLNNELCVLYRSELYSDMNISKLIQHIRMNNLTNALSEVNKLAHLICTIPFSTASVERSFSALKRVKSYTRNTVGQERLTNLSLLTIEKEMLHLLQSKPEFFDHVIEDFVNNTEGRMDFIYK